VTTVARPQLRPPPEWVTRVGAQAGFLAGALGLVGFVLVLLAPREAAERASDPVWLIAALADWLSTLLALMFLFGLAATAQRPSLAARVALVLAVVSTGASGGLHARVLFDYAAFSLDPVFAEKLHDLQTPLAEKLFFTIALVALVGWVVVASTFGGAARLSRTGRIAVGVAGLGIMLPIPLTAIALIVASAALAGDQGSTTRLAEAG
jgi:hypothetical protein